MMFKKIFLMMWLIILSCINLSYGMEAEESDHPTRWIYDAMGAWNAETQNPTTYNRTGKGIGIAVIEGPNFNLDHPSLKNSNITIIDFGGDNLSTRDGKRDMQYHANHVTAIIAGKPDVPFEDMEFEYDYLMQHNNPMLRKGYTQQVPFFKYYGGLAPAAKVYAYPRKLECEGGQQDKKTLLKIFEDIEARDDIRLINLSFKLELIPSIIKQLNRLADQGKIFIQAVGNDGQNMDINKDMRKESLQYYEGASFNDFSATFWNRHIWVGALSCYKSESLQVQMERWSESSYYVKNDSPFNKNFIMAPGSCIFSADQQEYAPRSGSSMATPFVTSALACALEGNDKQDLDLLIRKLHSSNHSFEIPFNDDGPVNLPVLNFRKLLEVDSQEKLSTIPSVKDSSDDKSPISDYMASPDEAFIDSLVNTQFLVESNPVYSYDHPTRWVYKAMGAWDKKMNVPTTYGRTGKGVGIAVIGAPYFNLDHPALKNSNITIVETYASRFQLNGYKKIKGYIQMGYNEFSDEPILKREPKLDHFVQNPPSFIMSEGKNNPSTGGSPAYPWHTNHATALIVGNPNIPFQNMDVNYLYHIQNNNPNLEMLSYPTFMPDMTYYGGLAPSAKVYAYPRRAKDDEQERDILSAIFYDIENKEDIRLINLSCKLKVNRSIIKQLNLLAEKGKIFIQAAGNDSKNLNINENAQYGTIEYVDGASFNDFSQTFWNRHIWVGATSCFKTPTSQVEMQIWNGSSYYVNRESHNKNFIMAPGACVLSASYDHYTLNSGTGISTSFVTGALACALESNVTQDPDDLITKLLNSNHTFEVNSNERVNLRVLNIKKLLY